MPIKAKPKGFSIMSRLFFTLKNLFIITLLTLCFVNLSYAAPLFQDDFNSYTGNPNDHGWNADNLWNTANVIGGAGSDGSNALRISFSSDQLNRWCNWNATQGLQEFYIKFNFKMDCGTGTCAGGAKFLKIFGEAGSNSYANTTTAFDYGTSSPVFTGLSYGSAGDQRDTASVLWYGGGKTIQSGGISPTITANTTGNINPKDGNWHTWEFHMKYNDDGQNNGIYEVWYDGTQVLGATGVNNRSINSPKYVRAIQLGGWNQNYGGKPYNIYYDNVVISTTRVTSGTLPTPQVNLSPPVNLRITSK
jgi:hypothetical protein